MSFSIILAAAVFLTDGIENIFFYKEPLNCNPLVTVLFFNGLMRTEVFKATKE